MIWFYDHIRMSKTLLNLLSVSYDFPTVPAFSQKWNIAGEKKIPDVCWKIMTGNKITTKLSRFKTGWWDKSYKTPLFSANTLLRGYFLVSKKFLSSKQRFEFQFFVVIVAVFDICGEFISIDNFLFFLNFSYVFTLQSLRDDFHLGSMNCNLKQETDRRGTKNRISKEGLKCSDDDVA